MNNDNQRNDRIVIPLTNGFSLVACRNDDPNYDRELYVGIVDGDGVWYQDLAVVRQAYQIGDEDIEWKDKEFNVLVYGDKMSEDYTHSFDISLYEEDGV